MSWLILGGCFVFLVGVGFLMFLIYVNYRFKETSDPYKCPVCSSNLAGVGQPCINKDCPECWRGVRGAI